MRPSHVLPCACALVCAILACPATAATDRTLPGRDPEVSAAFGRIDEICRDIEKIRGLAFTNRVRAAVQTPDDLALFVTKEVVREFGEDKGEAYVDALVKLGALEEKVDLVATYLTIVRSQVAAHYDPEKKFYFLLATNMPPQFLDVISSHELTHALQDHNFDLFSFMFKDAAAMRENSDAALARQCLVEGDAMLVMTIWTFVSQMGLAVNAAERSASLAADLQAGMKIDNVIELSQAQFDMLGPVGTEMAGAVRDLRQLPRFFVESIFTSYFQGMKMVDCVKDKGGWKAVDRLYREPPLSTEQVLHPEKLAGRRDEPSDVRLPELKSLLAAGWNMLEGDVLGELGIAVLLRLWDRSGAQGQPGDMCAAAAAGWGGDRYCYLVNKKTRKDLLAWKLAWDSPEDAVEFTVAYRQMLAARFPKMKKAGNSGQKDPFSYQVWEVEPGRFLKLMKKDAAVRILDTTDPAVLDLPWK